MKPKALIFDIFGTIVDWRTGVSNVCQKSFTSKNIDFDPIEFATLWRGQYQPAMQRIRSGNRGYIELDQLHKENLDIVLDETGLSEHYSTAERWQLNKAWEQLPPWPDSVQNLAKLKEHFTIAPCSNGSIPLMESLAQFGKLPWDQIVGAGVAKNYKPRPEVYLKSAEKLGLDPSEVVMIAAHNDDLLAAHETGLKTGFFPRPFEHGEGQTKDLKATGKWNYSHENFTALTEHLIG